MRRAICYTEPKYVLAGQVGNWKFCYQCAAPLSKGTKLRFDILSRGRDIDWEIPEAGSKKKRNTIWLESESLGTLHPEQLEHEGVQLPQYEFTLTKDVKEDEILTIVLGCPDPSKAREEGNRAQTNVQRRRSFYLSIDPKGKGEYKDTELFSMDVRGNVLSDIKIIVPSLLSKNQRFDIVIRFEDAFGNLTGNAPEGTLVELSYEQLRDNINWKLFVPETGFITLPNLYFNEEGVYRIQLKNSATQDIFFSPPIQCVNESQNEMYWGTFRGEFELYDCGENAENALRYARDDKSYQFYGSSPFEAEEETPNEIWKHVGNQVAEFNEDERFITFQGLQWNGDVGSEGLRTIVFLRDNKSILRKKDSKSNNLKKIYRSHTPKDFFSIPAFTMGKGVQYNFDDFTPEYEKVVEIYNAWGSSECTAKEGNLKPIVSKSKDGYVEAAEGSIRAALEKNCRFGFVAGGYDDRGIFSHLYETDQVQYTPGLTAILSTGHTRDQLSAALARRSCFATTGPRMIVGIQIAKMPMGSELSTKEKPGLSYNRHIEITAVGTEKLTQVEIIRNGKVIHTVHGESNQHIFTYDDSDPIHEVVFKSSKEGLPFVYYYIRAQQADGHVAWSSPIWIDYHDEVKPARKAKKKNGKG